MAIEYTRPCAALVGRGPSLHRDGRGRCALSRYRAGIKHEKMQNAGDKVGEIECQKEHSWDVGLVLAIVPWISGWCIFRCQPSSYHMCFLDNNLTASHAVILLRAMKTAFHGHRLLSRPVLALHVFLRFRPVVRGHAHVFHGLSHVSRPFHGAACCDFTAIAFFHGFSPRRPANGYRYQRLVGSDCTRGWPAQTGALRLRSQLARADALHPRLARRLTSRRARAYSGGPAQIALAAGPQDPQRRVRSNCSQPDCRLQTPNCRLQTANSRLQTANSRIQTAESDCKLQTPDCRLQTADSRLPTPDCALQTADSRLQTANSGIQTAEPRLQTADFRLQTPDSRLQTPDCRLQTPDCRLQTANSRIQTANSRFQIPDSRLHNDS